MIAWDSNYLIRYLITDDDERQTRIVLGSLKQQQEKERRVFLTSIVLCETVWVLESSYRINGKNIAKILDSLIDDSNFQYENPETFQKALKCFKDGRGDFSDYMIGLRAKEGGGVAHTLTFDKALKNETLFKIAAAP